MAAVPETRLAEVWNRRLGLLGYFSSVNNNMIGSAYIVTALFFFALAGIDSLVLRTQLAVPENELVGADKFNQLFTTHGTAMMFLFAVPMLEAMAIYSLPLLLGARDMVFPRMSAFSYWTYLFSGLLFYASTLPDVVSFIWPGPPIPAPVPDAGWFAYPPLTGPQYSPGLNIDFYLIGLGAAEFAGIGAAIEIIVTIFKVRAPGMALHRMPLYAWGLLVMAFAILFAFPAVIVSSTLLELERKFSIPFYDAARGGDPLLWQHLFWIFGHPEVYIMLIPATGIVSMIVPVFARRPIAGYPFIATAMLATGFLSFGLWVHHMFAAGLPLLAISLFGAASMMITIPSGVQVFAWIATMLNGKQLVLNTPMLFVIGFIVTFVLGGISGVMVASVPFDLQVHDTYFVVAHFHYVLVGGVVFPIFAGFYYWLPKVSGNMYDERLGKLTFWLMFIGFNLTFLPQHNAGLLGMVRRVFTYPAELGVGPYNLVSTIGAYVTALGVATFLWNFVQTVRSGESASSNPWNANTLEWIVPSPTPAYTFREIPEVRSRDPLWNQDWSWWQPERRPGGADAPSPGSERRAEEAEEPEHLWREMPGTTVMEAQPESIVRIAGDSIWPFAAAVAITLASVGLLFNQALLGAVGTLLSIACMIVWMWPNRRERELPGAGATLGYPALPAHTSGLASPDWWAMALSVLAVAITFAYVVFSYYYLRFHAPSWPPAGVALPALPLALAALLVLLLSAGPAYLAERAIRRGDQRGLRRGLAISAVLGVVFLVLQGYDYMNLGLQPAAHAYSAIFLVTAGAHLAIVIAGLVISVIVQVQAHRGYFNEQRFVAVQNTAMYWYFAVVSGVVTFAMLYLTPHVL
jgi:cytochrome c oxidase subunit I+III